MDRLEAISNRLYALYVYEAQDNEETPETIADTLTRDPLSVVSFLLDTVDDLRETVEGTRESLEDLRFIVRTSQARKHTQKTP